VHLLTNTKSKRNKLVIALFLPGIVFLWLVGWSLYWIGRQKESQKTPPAASRKEEDPVTLEAIAIEEYLET